MLRVICGALIAERLDSDDIRVHWRSDAGQCVAQGGYCTQLRRFSRAC